MNESVVSEPAVVSLSIPCRAEYVGVARLAILGVASRLNFTYDDVEDLRLAVGEACASAIERASVTARRDSPIRITCDVTPDALCVEVRYRLDLDGAAALLPDKADVENISGAPVDPESIGALLMEILVDSVEVETGDDGETVVRLLKRVPGL